MTVMVYDCKEFILILHCPFSGVDLSNTVMKFPTVWIVPKDPLEVPLLCDSPEMWGSGNVK